MLQKAQKYTEPESGSEEDVKSCTEVKLTLNLKLIDWDICVCVCVFARAHARY